MPLYVFVCPQCNKRFERLVPLSRADEAPSCPQCGSTQARRAITAAATLGSHRPAPGAASVPRSGIT